MTPQRIKRCFECGVITNIEYGSFCNDCCAKIDVLSERSTEEKATLESFIPAQKILQKMLNDLRQKTGRF